MLGAWTAAGAVRIRKAVATPNYSYEKRQRELAKKRKQEEKRQKKQQPQRGDGSAPAEGTAPAVDNPAPPAPAG